MEPLNQNKKQKQVEVLLTLFIEVGAVCGCLSWSMGSRRVSRKGVFAIVIIATDY